LIHSRFTEVSFYKLLRKDEVHHPIQRY
jgi:hypothetical protein